LREDGGRGSGAQRAITDFRFSILNFQLAGVKRVVVVRKAARTVSATGPAAAEPLGKKMGAKIFPAAEVGGCF
jgi:hypothetical protein